MRYWKIGFITAVAFAVFLIAIRGAGPHGPLDRVAVSLLVGCLYGLGMAAVFAFLEKKALTRLSIDPDAAFDQEIFRATQTHTFPLSVTREEALKRAADALADYGAIIDKRDDAAGMVSALTFQSWRSYGERVTISVRGDVACEVTVRAVPRIYVFRVFTNYGRSWEHVQNLTARISAGERGVASSQAGGRANVPAEVNCSPPAVMEVGAWQRLLTLGILYGFILLGLSQPGKTVLVMAGLALGFLVELFAFLKFRSQVKAKERSELQESFEVALNNLWPAIFAPLLTMDPLLRWDSGKNIAAVAICGAFALLAFNQFQEKKRERAQRLLLNAGREKAELERQLAEAKLVALSAQIEPHFLFNTLASIQYLIRNDAPKAIDMTSDLIRYLRLALPRMKQSTARLADELELVRAYLGIMQIRMGPRLQFSIDASDAIGDAQIPTMALITLVENAIKHGLEQKQDGGMIRVIATNDADDSRKLRLEVTDTGGGFSSAASGTGIGLANIRERLQTLYGSRAHLALEANRPSGVKAILILPMERK
ncbi:MAG: histidine kinase [Usitatibacteraceae bacterium]